MKRVNIYIVNKVAICLLFSCTLLLSCYYDKENELYGEVQCDTEVVSFAEDISPIISNNCSVVGCHVQGGSGTGVLENYTQIKSIVDDGSFRERVLVQRNMPPSGFLSECQIEHLDQWIASGAPDN